MTQPNESQSNRSATRINIASGIALLVALSGLFHPLAALAAIVVGIALWIFDRTHGLSATISRITIIIGFLGIVIFGILPHPDIAREPAKRIKCASNLRQIGLAMKMYANEHQGVFPPDFETTLANEEITPDVFICWNTNDDRSPLTDSRPTTLPAGTLGPGHCSYVCCIPAGLKDDEHLNGDIILAYEPLANHDGEGINVLYADDHVDWLDKDEANRIVVELKAGHNPPATQPN